ncbi:hypothetical protein H5410_045788 [Solanum commersonii]|uniref:Uncharacterized protein n=1 Tax=Solanum commersonii TaxID=4109 RepID=A0A9J5XC99_SOLCO|nr:hypothetical protein H5410_045788 [Solanum commersonii]
MRSARKGKKQGSEDIIHPIRTQPKRHMLHSFHKFNFVSLMEPFQHVRNMNIYNRRLKISKGYANKNGKIWLFVNHGFDVAEYVVRQNWDDNYSTNPILDFKRKVKKVKIALASWSRETYGEIFKQLILREEIARIKESTMRNFLLHIIEFESGDRNTRFFHSLVKGRRQKIKVTRIQNALGQWLEDDMEISQEAVAHFQNQVKQERDQTNDYVKQSRQKNQ